MKKYLLEFVFIFVGVSLAFLLDSWNDNRKDKIVESKILTEISSGLQRDSLDLANDEKSFQLNIAAIHYFRKIIDGEKVVQDSLPIYYFFLTRDFITVQNKSGYETLKSKGLESIENDSLRNAIINNYEVTYNLHKTFTENYDENKYMRNYFDKINSVIAPYFIFDSNGNLNGIETVTLKKEDKNIVKSYLYKLYLNRVDRFAATKNNQQSIGKLRAAINKNLKS